MFEGRPTWAEVDLDAIRHNMLGVKSLLKPETRFCAVVKADGYGHGAIEVARVALECGADYLAVAVLDEAIALREAGFKGPILILGFTPEYQYPQVAALGITQTIYNAAQARALSECALGAKSRVKAHLKVDTGMGRLGVKPEEAGELAEEISQLPGLQLEGVFTHFAMADSRDKSYTRKQFEVFKTVLADIAGRGIDVPIQHCCNSAATLDLPEMHLDMVRPGIVLYGLEPSPETGRPFELKSAMKFKTRVAQYKSLPPGSCISYGCTFVTGRDSLLATLPVGYADGWTRMLSGKAEIMVEGERAPIVGRICMDQCIADVTDVPGVGEGSEVLLFGGPELPAEEVAGKLGTINYEIVCMVGKRVPRVFLGK